MRGYRKILIAINGSQDVLRQGLRLARDEKCWVTIVKVIPKYEGDLNLTGIKNIEDVLNSNGQRDVSALQNSSADEGALVKTRVEEGDVYKKIIEVAEEEECDLIIMGGRKRSWIEKFFGNTVVEKVIHQAPCPVLVV